MYRAPLKDIRFALHQLVANDPRCAQVVLPNYSTEFADAVLEQAASFAETVLAPINQLGDRLGVEWTPEGVVMPAEFKSAYAQFVTDGWPQLRASPEYGGQGAPAVLTTAVDELWASANLAFKLCHMLTQGAIEAIQNCASREQKKKFLPKLVSGEWTGTMNLTEPQAGSDLGAIRTRAVMEGGSYRIFGQKSFVTYGDHNLTENIIHLVLARVEGSPPGTKGISLFIVPKVLVSADGTLGDRNDVRCVSIEHKLGIHASPTCTMNYGDHGGAIGTLVGEANRGLEYMFVMMNAARLSVGLEGYALAERAFQMALEHALTRVQGRPPQQAAAAGSKALPIAYHPDVKRMLLSMKAYTQASRAIALYCAMQFDLAVQARNKSSRTAASTRGELLIPIVKGWSTELGVVLTSLGIQVFGGMGYVEETGAAQLLRDARIGPIYEGANGIQASDLVGRKIIRDRGAAMLALTADMSADLRTSVSTDESVFEVNSAAQGAVQLLAAATDTLLDLSHLAVECVQSVAVPYLTLSGIVIGGWMMAKSHEISVHEGPGGSEFHASNRQIARFYMEHILPEASALARVVAGGSRSVCEADPAIL